MKRRGIVVATVGVVVLAVSAGVGVYAVTTGGGGTPVEMTGDELTAEPSAEALDAVAEARIFFGHQSVGANILAGLPLVYEGSDTQPDILESRTALAGSGPVLQHAAIGGNGDPIGKIDDFDALVRDGIGDSVDVALMKLCYIDFTSATDPEEVFDAYESTMAGLEEAYPDVTFVYTTVPLTVDLGLVDSAKATAKVWLGRSASATPPNLIRERYNELIRERYGDSGRLLDIAAGESYLGDGIYEARDKDGTTYRVMNPDLASGDGEHLNEQGSEDLASLFVQVVGA